eukprot:gnl/MRDRNA2_/MRDRNA2_96868_c0_seq1.p1 gnl/MRDRNA2_/MRDRNA2_96868_c0~~gnl/MRDRNA2_/MRDRNA2_96868_c0_seq1.p1  ORF type:complete len:617 (-),score=161.65 gnl/MRDRNA2_/MRDRNA2_96868_c0_seq1:24-1874(-)
MPPVPLDATGDQEVPQKARRGGPTQWVDRHAPKHLGEVIGNNDVVRKLAEWLRDWDDVCIHGKLKELKEDPSEAWKQFKPAPDNMNARAALISGPPGIGKTTTCRLIAACNRKYRVMEFNASDARNKTKIEQMAKSVGDGTTLSLGQDAGKLLRPVIIMDEVDGMAAGDKGGAAALLQMMAKSRNPIICICNDRQDKAVRDLAAQCLDLKFKRPSNALLARRVGAILGKEAAQLDKVLLESLIEACGCDMRQVINQVNMMWSLMAKGADGLVADAKDKQAMQTPFDACQKLLNSDEARKKSLQDRLDAFYLDEDLVPMLVHQNYLNSFEKRDTVYLNRDKSGGGGQASETQRCADAAELIALGDIMSTKVLQTQDYSIQSHVASISTAHPCSLVQGNLKRALFPVHLQKRGALAKADRLMRDLHGRIRPKSTTSVGAMMGCSYLDGLYRNLTKPLLLGDIKKGVEAIHAYSLPRECLQDHFVTLRHTMGLDDIYARRLDSRVKREFMEELQKREEQITTHGSSGTSKKKRKHGDDEEVPDDGKKKAKAKAKAKSGSAGVVSAFETWRKKGTEEEERIRNMPAAPKEPELVFRFIEGHTQAVRRRVLINDLLGKWNF